VVLDGRDGAAQARASSEDDHWHVCVEFAHDRQQLRPIHARHDEVRNDDGVALSASQPLDHCLGGLAAVDREPGGRQDSGVGSSEAGLVVDDQDSPALDLDGASHEESNGASG